MKIVEQLEFENVAEFSETNSESWVLVGKKLAISKVKNWEYHIPGWFKGEELEFVFCSKDTLKSKGITIFFIGPFERHSRKVKYYKIKRKQEKTPKLREVLL